MLEKGIETDIETGRPLEIVEDEGKIERERMLKRIIEESQNLANELKGQGGEVIKLVAQLLEARINELIKADAECHAYLQLLNTIGYKLNIGKSIAEGKTGGIIGKR